MTMTVSELAKRIGTACRVRFESFTIVCIVSDVKSVYGNERYLVSPFNSDLRVSSPMLHTGSQWVEAARIDWGA